MKASLKTLRRVIGAAALVLVAAFLVQGIVSTAASESPALSRSADEARAQREVLPSSGGDFRLEAPAGNLIAARGKVEPRERPTDVAGAESGLLVEILVDEGDDVNAGDPLARLDDAIQIAELDAAESEVTAARVALERAEGGSLLAGLRTARAELEEARAEAVFRERRAQRQEALLAGKVVSDEQAEEARLQATASAAREVSLEARLLQLETERNESIRESRASLERAEARLARARAALERRTIRAPEVGEVLQVKYVEGEYYVPEGFETEPLLILGDTRVLRVRADVDEREITGVELGRPARVRAPANPDHYFDAVVSEIGRKMGRKNVRTDDPIERTDTKILEVLVDLDRDQVNGQLLIGQRVDVFIER